MSPACIIVCEDDDDQWLLVEQAVAEARVSVPVRRVCDGEELLTCLRSDEVRGRKTLVLLDLDMPRKTGMAALKEMRADRDLKRVPVVILSGSAADGDMVKGYEAGANAFVRKPMTLGGLVQAFRSMSSFWITTADLPQAR